MCSGEFVSAGVSLRSCFAEDYGPDRRMLIEAVLVSWLRAKESLFQSVIRWVPMLFPALLVILLMSSVGPYAHAEITGSAHDFSSSGWSGDEICIPCHTPHNANSITAAPLWNHEETAATYTTYTSSTMDETTGQPGPISKVCLSCHDGTIALDSFGGQVGTEMISGTARLGIDLSDDHPIGMRWNHQTSAAGLCWNCHIPAGPGGPGGPTGKVEFYGVSRDRRIECASCHDVHNDKSLPNLLRVTMVGSELCLVCHNDK